MELDVIIPLYNEEENILVLYQELVKALGSIKFLWMMEVLIRV